VSVGIEVLSDDDTLGVSAVASTSLREKIDCVFTAGTAGCVFDELIWQPVRVIPGRKTIKKKILFLPNNRISLFNECLMGLIGIKGLDDV
jgi:hypothetical protein